MKYNRKQYMDKECSHDEYYGQFVTASLCHTVSSAVGEDKIKRSTDPHFNDISLDQWDSLNGLIRMHCGRSIATSTKALAVGVFHYLILFV